MGNILGLVNKHPLKKSGISEAPIFIARFIHGSKLGKFLTLKTLPDCCFTATKNEYQVLLCLLDSRKIRRSIVQYFLNL